MVDPSVGLHDLMASVNQLARTVYNHIEKTNTDIATLRTELQTNLVGMRSELDTTNSDVTTVRSDFATLFYVVKKGEK